MGRRRCNENSRKLVDRQAGRQHRAWILAEKEIISVGLPQGERNADDEEPTEARYLRKLLVWYAIKEFEAKVGLDCSDQLLETWKAPKGRRREEGVAMTHRMTQPL